MGFKENLRIGGSPIETKMYFFNKKQISTLGIAVIYFNFGVKVVDYHSFLPEQLTHDSLFAGNCLKELFLNKNLWRYKNITLGTDGGNHFKS